MAAAIPLSQLLTSKDSKPNFRFRSTTTIRCTSNSNYQELARSGAVVQIPCKEAATALSSGGYRLLDIRPRWEWEKARVGGPTLHVPLFVEDTDASLITLLKKSVHFGYVGLWTGQLLTTINDGFISDVEKVAPDKDQKLLVACGEGLRSRIAISKLHKGGYRNLGWLMGGFNRSSDGDFAAVEGTTELRYATVGGVSFFFLQILRFLESFGKEK